MNIILVKVVIIFIVLPINTAVSAEALTHQLLLEAMSSDYNNTATEERYKTTNKNVFISGNNNENGYTVGYSTSTTTQEEGNYQSKQTKLFLSTRLYEKPNAIDAFFNKRFDVYYLKTNENQGENTIKVLSPQLTWSNKEQTTQLNLGYSYSDYSTSQKVHQLTPTWGQAITDKDWLQLRAYLIRASKPSSENSNKSDDATSSLEMKLTHRFKKNSGLSNISSLQLSTVLGRREFAVDPDTATVYDSGGRQTGSIALNAKWNLTAVHGIGLSVGSANYEAFEQTYKSRYLALNWVYKPPFLIINNH